MNLKHLKFIFCIIALAIMPSFIYAQSPVKPKENVGANQTQQSKRSFKHNETIEEKYDKFKDITSVSLKMQVLGETLNGLTLLTVDTFQGKKPVTAKPSSEKIILSFIGVGDERKYKLFHSLIILADDERLKIGEAAYIDTPLRSSTYAETMLFAITQDTFNKIINAKKVEAQLGNTEFTFTESQLEALRDFRSRVTP